VHFHSSATVYMHGPCESGPSAWRALSMELTDYQRFECWTDPRMQGPRSALTFGAYRLQLTGTPSLRTFDEFHADAIVDKPIAGLDTNRSTCSLSYNSAQNRSNTDLRKRFRLDCSPLSVRVDVCFDSHVGRPNVSAQRGDNRSILAVCSVCMFYKVL